VPIRVNLCPKNLIRLVQLLKNSSIFLKQCAILEIHPIIGFTIGFIGFEAALEFDQDRNFIDRPVAQRDQRQQSRSANGRVNGIVHLLDRQAQHIGVNLAPHVGQGPAARKPKIADAAPDKLFGCLPGSFSQAQSLQKIGILAVQSHHI
jgi:hypothetical protein